MTSKRELKNRLDRIDDGKDHPKLTLCELLSADEIEDINEDLVRIDGTVYNGAGLKQAMSENLDSLEGSRSRHIDRTDES